MKGVGFMIIGEFCDVFPPELDGVGTVVRNYVEQLNETEEKCYYIAPKAKGTSSYSFPVIGYASAPIPKESYRLGLPAFDLPYHRSVAKIDFNIVHAHSPFTAGAEALKISRLKSIPLVATFHSKYYDDFYAKTKSRMLSKEGVKFVVSFFNKCDEVWTVNERTAETLQGYGYKGDIVIMPNGTNLWYPTSADRIVAQNQFGLGSGDVLLFVGQHNFKKNIKNIIDAIEIYSKTHKNFKMVFVGAGPDENKMKELVEEKGLSKCVVFAGRVSDRSALMGIYARADLLVFPSIYDNAPMVVREAAAAGTPSLLIRGSCAAEGITHCKNGFLCENSPEDIAKAIENALPRVFEVGNCARQTIPLPWQKVMVDVIDRYHNLIAKYRNGYKRKD